MSNSKLADTATVLEIFYSYPNEIGNAELKTIFWVESSASVAKIKNKIRAAMIENGITVFNKKNVDTATAYEIAGLDIDRLEKSYLKLKKLGFLKNEKLIMLNAVSKNKYIALIKK